MEFVIIDIETTGLYVSDQVLQVAATKVFIPEVHPDWDESFNAYCRPDMTVDELKEAWPIEQDHIDILHAEPLEDVAEEFRSWLQALGDLPWAAYNVPFEQQFLCKEPWNLDYATLQCIMLAATPVLRIPTRYYDRDLGHYVDGWKWPTLQEAYTELVDEKPVLAFHDASNDVIMAEQVLKALHSAGQYTLAEEVD